MTAALLPNSKKISKPTPREFGCFLATMRLVDLRHEFHTVGNMERVTIFFCTVGVFSHLSCAVVKLPVPTRELLLCRNTREKTDAALGVFGLAWMQNRNFYEYFFVENSPPAVRESPFYPNESPLMYHRPERMIFG